MTGHAVSYNLRHHRYGHLSQNRYKSILCEEDPYLLVLVRYIHLNPLRTRLVADYEELCKYPYRRHSAIPGYNEREWQDTDYVLDLFQRKLVTAGSKYREFVKEGIEQGGKARQKVEARSQLLCYWAATELGISQTQPARRLGIKQPAVSNAVRRGSRISNIPCSPTECKEKRLMPFAQR